MAAPVAAKMSSSNQTLRWTDDLYSSALTTDPDDVFCTGSDDEHYENPQDRERRIQAAAQRFLHTGVSQLMSTVLRGPFERSSGWVNPWKSTTARSRRQPARIFSSSQESSTPTHKHANARESENMARTCHLPTPESLKLVSPVHHRSMKPDDVARVEEWQESVGFASPETRRVVDKPLDDSDATKKRVKELTSKRKQSEEPVWLRRANNKRSKTGNFGGAIRTPPPQDDLVFASQGNRYSSHDLDSEQYSDYDSVDELMEEPSSPFDTTISIQARATSTPTKRLSPKRSVCSLKDADESKDELASEPELPELRKTSDDSLHPERELSSNTLTDALSKSSKVAISPPRIQGGIPKPPPFGGKQGPYGDGITDWRHTGETALQGLTDSLVSEDDDNSSDSDSNDISDMSDSKFDALTAEVQSYEHTHLEAAEYAPKLQGSITVSRGSPSASSQDETENNDSATDMEPEPTPSVPLPKAQTSLYPAESSIHHPFAPSFSNSDRPRTPQYEDSSFHIRPFGDFFTPSPERRQSTKSTTQQGYLVLRSSSYRTSAEKTKKRVSWARLPDESEDGMSTGELAGQDTRMVSSSRTENRPRSPQPEGVSLMDMERAASKAEHFSGHYMAMNKQADHDAYGGFLERPTWASLYRDQERTLGQAEQAEQAEQAGRADGVDRAKQAMPPSPPCAFSRDSDPTMSMEDIDELTARVFQDCVEQLRYDLDA